MDQGEGVGNARFHPFEIEHHGQSDQRTNASMVPWRDEESLFSEARIPDKKRGKDENNLVVSKAVLMYVCYERLC